MKRLLPLFLSLAACAAPGAAVIPPTVSAIASPVYPTQTATGNTNDYQTAPQTINTTCATAQYTSCPNNSTAGVQLVATSAGTVTVAGAFTGSLTPEISYDGVNFFVLPVAPISNPATTQPTITAPGTYSYATYGALYFQVRATALSAGTPVVLIHLTSASATVSTASSLGNVNVTNFPGTQAVSGSVNVGNFPATQPVSGTVSVGNFPATQTVTQSPWQMTLVTTNTTVVIEAVAGVYGGIINQSVSAQPAGTCTLYDNATTASGKQLYVENGIGAGQVITAGANSGIATANGITILCAVAPSGAGIGVLWR